MLEFVDPPKVTEEPVRPHPSERVKEANPLYAHLKLSYDRRVLNKNAPADWTGATIVLTIMEDDVEDFKRLIKQASKSLDIGYESSYEVVEDCARRIKFAARPKRVVTRKRAGTATPAEMPRRRVQ